MKRFFLPSLSTLFLGALLFMFPSPSFAACSVSTSPASVAPGAEMTITVSGVAATGCKSNVDVCGATIYDTTGNIVDSALLIDQVGGALTYSWIPNSDGEYKIGFDSNKGDSCTSGKLTISAASRACKLSVGTLIVGPGNTGTITLTNANARKYIATMTDPAGKKVRWEMEVPASGIRTINISSDQIRTAGIHTFTASDIEDGGTDTCGPVTANVTAVPTEDPKCTGGHISPSGQCCRDPLFKDCPWNACDTNSGYQYDAGPPPACVYKPPEPQADGPVYSFSPADCKGSDGTTVEGVDSAIGCIPTGDIKEFMKFMLKFAFGAAGGIIVLMLIKIGYDILTSAGDPNKIAESKQTVISLLSGLVLIIFSLVLLRFIGVDVLGLPGFS